MLLCVNVCAVSCRALLPCRNNTSDYYVNSKKVNVKEVTTLLKAKGIDLDNNRFLILQVGASVTIVVWCVCWRTQWQPLLSTVGWGRSS
jgi:hypothetical protein